MFYSLLCDYFKSYNSSNIYLWYFSTYCGSHSCINSLIHTYCIIVPIVLCYNHYWYLCSAPPPFRPGNPALCGSCPLVTPYQCRLGDLLCYTYMLCLSTILCVYAYVFFVFSFVFWGCFPLQLSPSVLWYCWLGLLICKNRLPYNLHCVGGDVKHCTIQSMLSVSLQRNESLTFYRQPFVTTLIVNLFKHITIEFFQQTSHGHSVLLVCITELLWSIIILVLLAPNHFFDWLSFLSAQLFLSLQSASSHCFQLIPYVVVWPWTPESCLHDCH